MQIKFAALTAALTAKLTLSTLEEHVVAQEERMILQLADVLVSPTHYMTAFLKQRGWRLPRKELVIPNVVPTGPESSVGMGRMLLQFAGLYALELPLGADADSRSGHTFLGDGVDNHTSVSGSHSPMGLAGKDRPALEELNLGILKDNIFSAAEVALAYASGGSEEVGPPPLKQHPNENWGVRHLRDAPEAAAAGGSVAPAGGAPPGPEREVWRLAFFSRLEERKGLKLFVNAVSRLDPAKLDKR